MEGIDRYLKLTLPAGQSCFLWGARKTGKTTYLHAQFPEALWIDLLDASIYQQYMRHPNQLEEEIRAHPEKDTIIVDEVQRIPALLDTIHRLIERYKEKRFILCGSSARRIRAMGANLLGGRAWRYSFLPLCYPELKEINWERICNHGLIPSHYLAKNHLNQSLSAYIDYILAEVHYEANLRKKEPFVRFLDTLGFCHGELINYSNIARDVGIDSKTVQSYFEILEDMYLGYYLHPYRANPNRQIIAHRPKFYLFDVGIANYLRHYRYTEMRGSDAGKSLEHYLFLELKAYQLLHQKREEIHFWRTKEGYEVDFIVDTHAIEVKLGTPIEKKHLKGLQEFSKDHPHTLHVVSLEPRKRVMLLGEKEVWIWPIEAFLQALWAGEIWGK